MAEKKYQICSRCVMDTSDQEIVFDYEGVCNHCHSFHNDISKRWFPNQEGADRIKQIVKKIKKAGRGKKYDCILGLSGGLDSSYLALELKKLGLRTLAFHVDAGWNSEIAVRNIKKVVNYCQYDLCTKIINWDEIRDLQLSYLESGLANQDVAQDHAFFAYLYHFSLKNRIRYVISGGNIATEAIFPKSWHHDAMDGINLRAIHKKHGKLKLRDYRIIGFFKYYFYYPFVKKIKVIRPLNFMPYSKDEALKKLQTTIGYENYGRKHDESRFTKFFQNYYLPHKYNMDKRRPHLSSMILAGLITREQAINELELPLYDERELAIDKEFIAKRLEITVFELDRYCDAPNRSYSDYRNWDSLYMFMKKIQNGLSRKIKRLNNGYY